MALTIETSMGTFTVQFGKFQNNGNLAIQLFDGYEPYARVSVNLDELLPPREFYFDDNNCGLLKQELLDSKLFHDTGKRKKSGYCFYPLFKLDDSVVVA